MSMAARKTRKDFSDTEEGKGIRLEFQKMTDDVLYNTSSTYNRDTSLYPDNLIPFVDKHMNYLVDHPKLEADKYLANVKLITRIR